MAVAEVVLLRVWKTLQNISLILLNDPEISIFFLLESKILIVENQFVIVLL
jgi:hypothetical protein